MERHLRRDFYRVGAELEFATHHPHLGARPAHWSRDHSAHGTMKRACRLQPIKRPCTTYPLHAPCGTKMACKPRLAGSWHAAYSPTRVMLGVQGFEPLAGDVRVDGGRADIGMPQQQLHHAQIRAVVEQMGGKGVAQGVR